MSEKFYEKFTYKKTAKKSDKKNDDKNRNKNTNDRNTNQSNKSVKIASNKNESAKSKKAIGENKITENNLSKNLAKNITKTDKTGFSNRKNIRTHADILLKTPLFDNSLVPEDAKKLIENFDQIVQGVKPLNSKQIQQLPENIRNLSHQMTDDRSTRRLGYMNENIQLSAYVRYFTWWNLVRLTRLFSNLPAKCFPENDAVCLDLGSGPLTVVIALWLARPELRTKKITWYCLDVSQNSLSLGEELYLSTAAQIPGETWKIIRVKGSFGTYIKEKADFVTCANMLNELDQANDMPPEFQTKKYYEQFKSYGKNNTKFLLIEPGVPKASRTLCLLRDRFLKENYDITAPCPHREECPMNGFKAYTGSSNKWCNFAFNTEDAPKKLQKLSENAKLPKERAVLSFISAIPVENDSLSKNVDNGKNLELRVASDGFRLPGNCPGHYACSRLGLTIVTSSDDDLLSGDFLKLKLTTDEEKLPIDEKTGAKKIVISNGNNFRSK